MLVSGSKKLTNGLTFLLNGAFAGGPFNSSFVDLNIMPIDSIAFRGFSQSFISLDI